MGSPLAISLRERVIAAVQRGDVPIRSIAEEFQVSPSSIYRWLKKAEDTGNLAALPHQSNHEAHLSAEDMEYIQDFLLVFPNTYLKELVQVIQRHLGKNISQSALCETLQRHGITRKVLDSRASERNEELRQQFLLSVSHLPLQSMVWLDEVGKNGFTCQRKYGYSPIGKNEL